MVTLRLVDGKLSLLVEFGPQKFLDIWLGKKMLEISGEITFLVNIRSQESKRRFLHIAKGEGVRELALGLMRNEGPNSGMVCAAHGAEAEPKHINGMATKSKPSPLSCMTQPHSSARMQLARNHGEERLK